MIDALTAGGFLVIAGFVFVLGKVLTQMQRNPVRERLAVAVQRQLSLVGGAAAFPLPQDEDDDEPPMLDLHAGRTEVDRELRQAGWYRPGARRDFFALRNALVIFVMITAGGAAVAFGPTRPELVQRSVLIGLIGMALGWSLPRLYLRRRASLRISRLRRSLPDALDLTTMCLSGGLSLPDSLEHVARDIFQTHPDLAVELMIVHDQTQMRSSETAFAEFAKRTELPEIQTLSGLISHGQRLGTDVSGAIREYADSMRFRRRQSADERSNKAGVKMLFPLTMCLLPSVFIILWGPSILMLMQELSRWAAPAGPGAP